MHAFKRHWQNLWGLLLFSFLFIVIVPRSTLLLSDQWQAIGFEISAYDFDYVSWEIEAILQKINQNLFNLTAYMDEPHRSDFVRDYMQRFAELQSLQARIDQIFTDPTIPDPFIAAADLIVSRDNLRASLADDQLSFEGILESQVAAILAEQGFSLAGQIIPPVSFRFTALPNALIVSPRDHIQVDVTFVMDALPVDKRTLLEDSIDQNHDVSSLIVPIGGLGIYPAMVMESSNLSWLIQTIAHEWLHHYLMGFPLGWDYLTSSDYEPRAINETTASVFGDEIGNLVLQKYYPELYTPPPLTEPIPPPPAEPTETPPAEEPVFDFGAELHQTRIKVDELLGEGRIEEAEAYMEARRVLFVENGYSIRKLNQAFFAFYGGYQSDSAVSYAGTDPTGDLIRSLRALSPSLYDFIAVMRNTTSLETLRQQEAALK